MRAWLAACAALGLAACASAPPKRTAPVAPVSTPKPAPAPARTARAGLPLCEVAGPAQEDLSKRGDYVAGGLYKPGVRDSIPTCIPDVDAIPEPQVVSLPRSPVGNRPVYTVLDRDYHVLDDTRGFVEQGLASFYGEKFHGRRTSNLEVYDMFAFSAAHKSLPLPSFARVTNLDTGKSVVVRVNDRGPFHDGRVVDLSFAAAVKLGIYPAGTGRVEVRALHPGEPQTLFANAPAPAPAPAAMGAVNTAPSTTATVMDRAVAALPAASSTSSPRPAASAAPAPQADARTAAARGDYRFDMQQGGKAMSAEEFDAWMRERQVRVATGRATTPEPRASTPAPAVATPAAPAAAPSAGDAVTLQVASFAARDNADRALEKLRGAGIAGVALHDGEANGQKVWRLRIGPLAAASEAELATRVVGLGFGPPRRVRD